MRNTRISTSVYLLILLQCLVTGIAQAAEAEDYSGTLDVFKKSPQVQPYFATAYGYAVFPTVGKGGLGIGGSYGKGQVYRGDAVTGKVSLVQVSIGFQAGGQVFREIIFFEDKRAYDEFTSGSFELDAKASAVAITAAAQAQTGTTGNTAGMSAGPATSAQAKGGWVKGLAIFVHVKGGLMYEAAVGGQKFSFEPL